jgi:hypothetical protein
MYYRGQVVIVVLPLFDKHFPRKGGYLQLFRQESASILKKNAIQGTDRPLQNAGPASPGNWAEERRTAPCSRS